MIYYQRATHDQLDRMAELTTQSFIAYPLYQVIRKEFKDEQTYRKFVYTLQYVFLKAFLKYQLVFIGIENRQVVSVAMLEDPNRKVPNLWDYIRVGGLALFKYMNVFKVFDYLKLIEDTKMACKQIEETKWHLSNLAVDHAKQGKKLGSRMLEECIIPYVKEQKGKLLTLTTNTEQNSRFYVKNGFIAFDKRSISLKDESVENWSFQMSL